MIFLSFFCLIESFQMKGRGESRDADGNWGATTVPQYRLTVDFPNLILYDRGNKRNSGEKRAYKWKIRQR